MNKRTYVCRRLRLYNFLTERGFVPYQTAPDKYDCKRIIWLYEDCKEIQNAVKEYYSMK